MNRFFEIGNMTAATPDSITVGTTTTVVSAANPIRMFEIITNISDTAIYIAFGSAALASKGILLNPGDSLAYGLYTSIPWNGSVNAICASANKVLARQTVNKTAGM